MDFKLTKEQVRLVEKAKEFVKKECLPLEESWPIHDYDVSPEQLQDLRRKFLAYGFDGIAVPKKAGGKGKGLLAKCLVFEQLKQTWVLHGMGVLWPFQLDPHPSLYDAPIDQKKQYLYPVLRGEKKFHFCFSEPGTGSDFAAIKATAVKKGDNYVINGMKRWAPDPSREQPDYWIVYAVTDPGKGYRGISSIIVDFGNPGVKVKKVIKTMALGSYILGQVADLEFRECVVPVRNLLGEENEGFRGGMDQLNRNRVIIAMGAVAISQRCLTMATKYAKERVTFGKPIADRQAVQWMLADSALEIQMGRLLVYHAAWKSDQGEDIRGQAAMAKAFCPEMSCRVVDRTIQIYGGVGVIDETRLGRAYAFERIARIAEGSGEIMRLAIAKCLLDNWPLWE